MDVKAVVPLSEEVDLGISGYLLDGAGEWLKEYLHVQGDPGHMWKFFDTLDISDEDYEEFSDCFTSFVANGDVCYQALKHNLERNHIDIDLIVKDFDCFDASISIVDSHTLLFSLKRK